MKRNSSVDDIVDNYSQLTSGNWEETTMCEKGDSINNYHDGAILKNCNVCGNRMNKKILYRTIERPELTKKYFFGLISGERIFDVELLRLGNNGKPTGKPIKIETGTPYSSFVRAIGH